MKTIHAATFTELRSSAATTTATADDGMQLTKAYLKMLLDSATRYCIFSLSPLAVILDAQIV